MFVVSFLEEMEATVAFSPLENWGSDVFDASKPLGFKLAQQQACRNQSTTAPAAPRARRKAPHHYSDRVLSESKPQATRTPFAKRAVSTRTKPPTPHEQREQKQVFWAAMGAEGNVTLRSTASVLGTLTGTPSTARLSGRIPP